jgi:hypothetical protein
MSKRGKKTCEVCDRLEGSTKDRCNEEDGTPLGAMELCPTCGKWACPDCIHEIDCCFSNVDFVNGVIKAPPGWTVWKNFSGGRVEYRRNNRVPA